MPKKSEVTVIMPFYKKIEFFKKTYLSLINQTYKNFKVIIVYDDEKKDELIKLKKIIGGKKKFKIIVNKKNIGAGKSRNKGIDHSRTKYIAFLDCDDYWKRRKLETQLNFMKKKKLRFSFTSYSIVNENNNYLKTITAEKTLNYTELLKSCDIGLSTVIVDRKLLIKNKFPSIKTKEDFILWLKIAKSENIIYGLSKDLCYWRKSKNSLSSNTIQKLSDAYKVYNFYEKKNMFLSFLFTMRLSLNYLVKHFLGINFRI